MSNSFPLSLLFHCVLCLVLPLVVSRFDDTLRTQLLHNLCVSLLLSSPLLTGNALTVAHTYTAFESRYKMPSRKPAEYGETYIPGFWNGTYGCAPSVFLADYNYGNSFYSFEAGLVHFIFLNPYTPSQRGSKQQMFLLDDLRGLDRKRTPWIVVVTHCPFYNSNKAHRNESQTVIMKVRLREDLVASHVTLLGSSESALRSIHFTNLLLLLTHSS